MATLESRPADLRFHEAAEVPTHAKPGTPVKAWAAFGAICLAFIVFVLTKWVTGPYFEQVPSGPSEPPAWMDAVLTTWQIAGVLVALGFLYWFVVRPWRRDGRMSTDGMLCISCFILYFQDPLGNFYGHWFTYNTTLVQYGSWVNEIPGWMSYGAPGAMLSEPLVFTGAFYIWAFFGLAVFGCAAMRKAKERWPQIGTFGLMMVAFVTCATADLVLEGLVMMPLGAYVYGGAHDPMLFGGAYHQFPLYEAIFAGALFAGLACLRYFRNDKGETVAERGVAKLEIGARRKQLLRLLAFVGATQMIMLVTYNIPVAGFVGSHAAEWPKSIKERSYFTSRICGEGTNRLCPGPAVPNDKGSKSAHLGLGGQVVVPEGTTVPKVVPFDRGRPD